MPESIGYHHRGIVIGAKIRNLLCALGPSTYDEISQKIEYWIEYALAEQSVNASDLVEQLSYVAWGPDCSSDAVARFLKEFHDAPHRSEQAKSLVDEMCKHVLRWFAAASAEDLKVWDWHDTHRVAWFGGEGFVRAASFVGYLIERSLLSHELVRRHLVKPLIALHYTDSDGVGRSFKAMAIYQLLIAARNTLLQGLLEPEDVQVCFKALDANIDASISLPDGGVLVGSDATKLNELRDFHATWLKRKEEERRGSAGVQEPGGEEEGTLAAEVLTEVETPVAFTPQDLPNIIDIGIPSSILEGIEPPTTPHDVESSSDPFTNGRTTAISSPTPSISTESDLTPTELGEDTGEGDGKRIPTRHETFYLEDGNVEIVCGHTIFRIHSPILSFSSRNLRDTLSPSTLLNAPMPKGCPRITFKDSGDDFAVLLKMIYTPGFPARNKVPEFTTLASLLRMVTKYGFSDVREQLVDDLKSAYPTKWEDFQTAKVLGEDIFGLPKPHPNAVLNLFLEQNIKFALPFAAYRASTGGFSGLTSDEPGTVLPRLTLASIIHGRGEVRREMTLAAQKIAYVVNMGVCSEGACVLNVDTNPMEQRMEALKKLFDILVDGNEDDMLSSPSLGTLVCMSCATRLEIIHLGCRKRWVWEALPSLLGWGSWGDV